MPIHLPAPAHQNGGPDGRGWTRLSLASMGGLAGDECALRPRDYSHMIEATDTRRARYGGYGTCIRDGRCEGCPIATAAPTTLQSLDARVLVRFGQDGRPCLMNRPEDGWASLAQRWTWQELARIKGWEFGPRYRDEHGDGFWLERCDSDTRPGLTAINGNAPAEESSRGIARTVPEWRRRDRPRSVPPEHHPGRLRPGDPRRPRRHGTSRRGTP